MPAENLFGRIIYNTWIELTYHQNEEDILAYAGRILESRMPPGVLMIDDGWAECYGDWRFHSGKFPHPEQMIEKLHGMGYQVMVWVCPYVSPDSLKYREARIREFSSGRRKGSRTLQNGGMDIRQFWIFPIQRQYNG